LRLLTMSNSRLRGKQFAINLVVSPTRRRGRRAYEMAHRCWTHPNDRPLDHPSRPL